MLHNGKTAGVETPFRTTINRLKWAILVGLCGMLLYLLNLSTQIQSLFVAGSIVLLLAAGFFIASGIAFIWALLGKMSPSSQTRSFVSAILVMLFGAFSLYLAGYGLVTEQAQALSRHYHWLPRNEHPTLFWISNILHCLLGVFFISLGIKELTARKR